jgi:MFS family permease
MSGFLSLCFYFSTMIPIAIIDRTGRRPLLLAGLAGMAICMFILAGTTSTIGFAPGIAATVSLFVYDFCFGAGWIPGPWLLAAEYAPLMTRSQSAAFATSATWIFTFLVAEITPPAINNIGWKTYIIFGALNLSFIPMIYFFYPEVCP